MGVVVVVVVVGVPVPSAGRYPVEVPSIPGTDPVEVPSIVIGGNTAGEPAAPMEPPMALPAAPAAETGEVSVKVAPPAPVFPPLPAVPPIPAEASMSVCTVPIPPQAEIASVARGNTHRCP
jgi:hypothetical protein